MRAFLVAEDRVGGAQGLSHPRRSPRGCLRRHRAFLQPAQTAFETGLHQPHGVRGPRHASLIRSPRNRQQASMSFQRIELTTDLIDCGQRDEAWRDITRPFFETRAIRSEEGLSGSLASAVFGGMLVGPTSFNGQCYDRSARIVTVSGLDQYMVQLFLQGSLQGDCAGEPVQVQAGDIVVFDLACSFSTRVRPGRTITLIVPRDMMEGIGQGRVLHGAVLRAGQPVTRILTDIILSIEETQTRMDPTETEVVAEGFTTLLANGLARLTDRRHFADGLHPSLLRRRALAVIEQHLSDPDLGPETLARHLNVSRAHLYRMFAAEGGVGRAIANRRLDSACRVLTGSGQRRHSVTEVAYMFGFSSSARFLRAFKARFGMTPSEARSLGALARQDAGLQAMFHRAAHRYGGRASLTRTGGE